MQGDGGNSTYSVARALAAPSISVRFPTPDDGKACGRSLPLAGGTSSQIKGGESGPAAQARIALSPEGGATGALRTLPRGDVLLIGGDLAYPNPTRYCDSLNDNHFVLL